MKYDHEHGLPIHLDAGEILEALLDDDTGWTIWNGGPAPVMDGTLVDIVLRNGKVGYRAPSGSANIGIGLACARDWYHDDRAGDIIAYRRTKIPDLDVPEHYRRAVDRIRKYADNCRVCREYRGLREDMRSSTVLEILEQEGLRHETTS